MYMNRMRHDDFIDLFKSVGHRIMETQPTIDKCLQDLLKSGNLELNARFRAKQEEVLTITWAWFTTKKNI